MQTVEDVKRGAPPAGLSANAAAQAFAGPEGHVANAEGDAPPARILLQVDRVTAPAFFAEAADAKAINDSFREALRNDILATPTTASSCRRARRSINNAVLRSSPARDQQPQ